MCLIVLFTVPTGCVKESKVVCGKVCSLDHRREVSALCLLYKIYHIADHPMNEYLKHFVAVRNARASAAQGELALLIPRCRTDQCLVVAPVILRTQ